MVHSVRFYEVDPADADAFLAAFHEGGFWREFSRNLPGHIYTEVLRSYDHPSVYLAIEFWTSRHAQSRSISAPEIASKRRMISGLAAFCQDLGVFSFLPRTCESGFPEGSSDLITNEFSCSESAVQSE